MTFDRTSDALRQYNEMYERSLSRPDEGWLDQAELITWSRKPTQAVDASNPPGTAGFQTARLNACFNALDRHVEAGHEDRVAVIYDSPVTGATRSITYGELLDDVERLAGVLVDNRVAKGCQAGGGFLLDVVAAIPDVMAETNPFPARPFTPGSSSPCARWSAGTGHVKTGLSVAGAWIRLKHLASWPSITVLVQSSATCPAKSMVLSLIVYDMADRFPAATH